MSVLDASVVAKCFLHERGTEIVEDMMRRNTCVSPDIVCVEVASAITRRHRNGLFTSDEAKNSLESWFVALASDTLLLFPSAPLLPDAGLLAMQLRHPLQDCVYLALAMQRQETLITADTRFIAKAKAVYTNVSALEES